ncbi:MAG: hypothetical protein WC986_14655 [Elusimicrobiota bacterium]|jgi:hypothetical protein
MKHSKPVQVNFTSEQKEALDIASNKAGVPLAVWLRMAALAQMGAVKDAVAEAKRALSDPQLVAIAKGRK